jgi:hypothetical protein
MGAQGNTEIQTPRQGRLNVYLHSPTPHRPALSPTMFTLTKAALHQIEMEEPHQVTAFVRTAGHRQKLHPSS